MTGKLLRWIGSMLWIVCGNKMHVAVSRNVCLLAPLLCMLDVFLVMWYVLVVVYLSWKGLTSLLNNCHACKHCGHAWESDTICTANPLRIFAGRISSKVLWCLNLRMIGSMYLLPSLQRLRQYLRCIWRWLSKLVTSILLIGQPTVGKRMRLSLRALRRIWKSLNLPIHRYLLSLNILSLTTIRCSPFP